MTTDDTDNGWDSLAEDLGIEAPKPAAKAEKPLQPARPAPARPQRKPRPEVEQEADDFGSGVSEEAHARAALYDPGPETVADDADDIDDAAAEPIEDGEEGDEPVSDEEAGTQEGGKRKRRRRRRKKKAGEPEGAAAEGEPAAEADEADEAGGVEEGEAPAPLEDDDDEEAVHSAIDDELEAEATGPRPVWHVMTWSELVGKLHRPG